MIKDILNSNESMKPNTREIEVLRENFPACFKSDGSFDLARFKEYLNDKVTVKNEGYELKFLGKNYARLLASVDSTTVIVPDEEHNNKPENKNSENIYISGDNLDGLKHLLKSYAGQVKCIYIDPPYNTGSDGFVYNDNFNFTVDELSEKLSIDDEQAQRILDLTKRGSASHSAWLMFMYPRLLLARDLLTEDGVIFISIDDNEQANCKLICDDVFGENNFIGNIVWNNATDNNPTNIACEHEYVLCYGKNRESLEPIWKSDDSSIKSILIKKGIELTKKYNGEQLQKEWKIWYSAHKSQLGAFFDYKFIDENGIYAGSRSVHNPGKTGYDYDLLHPITGKVCKAPLMGYRFPKATMEKMKKEGRLIFGDDENKIVEIKVYASEYQDKLSSVYVSDGRSGANELKKLFPEHKKIFKNPKSVDLVRHILAFLNLENAMIVDFFAGSSTTAQALLEMNVSYNLKNKYIMVQWQEECNNTSEAYKEGYSTIDQIGMERIKRAAAKLKAEYPDTTTDLGFKHFTLQETEQVTLDKLEDFVPDKIFLDNDILSDFGVPTVLTTWLVRDGYGFTAPVQKLAFADYNGYYMDKHLYLLDADISKEAITAIADKFETDGSFNPENIVIFGYSFTWTALEELKVNLARLKATEKNLHLNFDVRY